MAGILGRLTGLDAIRDEMKQRVDEVLKAGAEWKETAEKLTKTIQELTETIREGRNVNLKPVKADLRKLSKETEKLAQAFNHHRQTLAALMERI
jgi:chromosome segregation ATPase